VRRKDVGRDAPLTVRMGAALAVIGAIYLAAFLLLLLGLVSAANKGDLGAALGYVFFLACIPAALYIHLRDGGKLALRAARARVLRRDEVPELYDLIARVAAQADMPAPAAAVIASSSANAFAVGTSRDNEVIAFTTELLDRLNPEELEAVIGHEISHLANRDGMVMTFASGPAMAGSTIWDDADRLTKVAYLLFAPLWAPVYALSVLLMWSMSRYREYVADRGSALLTGAPEQLMSALAKIGGVTPAGDLRGAGISALCIVSARPRRRLELFMDHPPLEKRLERLEEIARETGRPVH
jgi:heat shock protein HtpX